MQHSHDKTTSHHCPACAYGHFTRNNYFTGKLLVERDFTDEQRYYVDKLRHHQQRLHGWGVVCGLKVKPHDSDACRDRFVCVTAGSAVDCCGHDIIVREDECVDLRQFPEIQQLQKDEDTDPHKLQICVRYRECPTEEIPVLYDECGCDDTQCAPNRILESHEFSIILDGEDEHELLRTPKLKWGNTIDIPQATFIAVHDASHRLYVTRGSSPFTVTQVSTDNHTKITSRDLPSQAMSIGVSKDGSRLYVVTKAVAPATLAKLHVLKTEPGLPTLSETEIPNTAARIVRLAVAKTGVLYGLIRVTGDLLRFPTDLDTNATPAAPTVVKSFGNNVDGPALSSDGKQAFAVGPNAEISQIKDIDGTSATQSLITLTPALPAGTALAWVTVLADDLLAVSERATRKLHLIELGTTPKVKATVVLDHEPGGFVVSPGGHWIYVREGDTTGSFLQAVSIEGMQSTPQAPPTRPIRVGDLSAEIAIDNPARHLYVSFLGSVTDTTLGGLAVIDLSEEACDEILWRDLEGCSQCEQPNCIVLATIENYRFGDKILELVEPADPTADQTNHRARINNRLGRRLLPSTQLLTEAVQCLLEHQADGTVGPQGETGPAGGITDVSLTMVRCNIEESAQIVTQGNQTTLELIIPTICDRDLAHISGINWQHASDIAVNDQAITRDGLLIAFSHPVMTEDLHGQSVQVLRRQRGQQGISLWGEIAGKINPIWFNETGNVTTPFTLVPPETRTNGVQFKPDSAFNAGDYRVVVKGDFIRDAASKKGVDANHRPPWFGSNDYMTGDSVAGGTFESWFTLKA